MQGSKLYVGNLNYDATVEQLKELFADFGEIVDVIIIPRKGFGFVEFQNVSDAEKAKDELNGTEFLGRTLRIDEAKPKRQF